ncbi:copper-binding protein [Leptotrichia sp. OH3620_COT-345]|uniref:metal ABC transporter solute-binding protein, Zn/Mn family n=1 Tax=Leptotrichia sp. OH3620_COT-345 TaxID=2491048 RepID=UPI000F64608D|nr:zinc ABC transporter substrate-binding protein [Leptotrichia sp. OH3620_COT-345]RRD40454.1 copper-binding protein [Leptotrichia sp. OH3620_COT-345]
MKKTLILLIILTMNILYGNNKVLTSIQPIYSIAKNITENTDIEIYSIFDSDVSMDYGKSAFDNKNLDLSVAKNSIAVIDVAKVWGNDYLYEYARRQNIKIVEIDASYSFSDNDYSALSLLSYRNGDRNPYVWLSHQNAMKMAQIIAEDLVRLFPKNERKIMENLSKFTEAVRETENKYLKETIRTTTLSVISPTENLDYLFNELNIFVNYIQPEEITVGNIKEIIKKNKSKIIISDKWLKKEIISEIEKNGGKFIVLDTFNIPREVNGKMDPNGYLTGMKENIEKLIKVLK